MKIVVYQLRDDEKKVLDQVKKEHPELEIVTCEDAPDLHQNELLEKAEGVSILGMKKIDESILTYWKQCGIQFVSTRTIGYDHIDINAAKKVGIRVCHASYAPNGVADFTVMLMLMCLRNYKQALWRGQVNDFSLYGLQGKELRSLCVGVVGSGKIGAAVISNLTGFGCRILVYDPYEKESIKPYATYVPLDTLYKEADIITLHVPLNETSKYMINEESIQKMKDGVILINCARGALADLDALIHGIESEKIGALGLDTVDGEEGITHVDHRINILRNQKMAYLRQFRNVVMTQHMAFYTEEAVESMVRCGILGILDMKLHAKGNTEI